MTTKQVSVVAFLTMFCLALPAFAQQAKTVTKGPIVIQEYKHDTGPRLREITPLFPEFGTPDEHEIDNKANPNHPWSNKLQEKDPVLQTLENSPSLQTPNFNVEFDGIGYGDSFFCNCMPPDNDGAPGTTQYVQYVNTTYQVFDKAGNTVLGPLSGKDFWTGFGGSCETDNSGDPIIRFDAAAQRWVVSQFAINNTGNDYECVAVSQTDDATGSYNRYAFTFADFPDYPKMGVWPDAYYFTFNNFNLAGTAFVGANVCAVDRTAMLAGKTAKIVCFQQNNKQYGMLPTDLDGPTPPPAGTPNFVMELDPDGSNHLSMFQFHVDFGTPANSTFTGPTLLAVPAFTPLCNGGACVKQPGPSSDSLDTLADRLMYRLVYRNFSDHSALLVNHSVTAGNSGGVRWYEFHNPETTPKLYQSGTFAPDAQYRWMGSVAMDQNQDIAIGYSRSGGATGQFPSLVYAGRIPTDTLGTMESEVVLKAGAGSQSSGGRDRWGDYGSMTIDPTDDCTFWFSQEYLKATGQNGGFNWSTAIGSFHFPGCGGSGGNGGVATLTPTSLKWGSVVVGTTTTAKSITLKNTGTATLNISNIAVSGDYALATSTKPCGSTLAVNATCLIKVTFSPTQLGVRSGDVTLTDDATNSPQTVPLSGTGIAPATLTPATATYAATTVGSTSVAKVFVLGNKQSVALTGITAGTTGDFSISTSTCSTSLAAHGTCKISVVFKPTATGTRSGQLTVSDSANNSPQSSSLKGTGK